MEKKRGQIQISLAVGLMATVAYIIAPVLWITNTNQATAVEQTRQNGDIKNLQDNYKTLSDKVDKQNEKLDALLLKSGINPAKFNNGN